LSNARVVWDIDPGTALQGLETKIRNKAMRIALSAGAAPVKEAAVAAAPSGLGNLKKAMRIKIKNYKNSSKWVAMIGASSSYKRARKKKVKRTPRAKTLFGKLFRKAKKRVTKTKTFKSLKKKFTKDNSIRPAQYQKLQDKGGKYQRAKHFIDAAFLSSKSQFEAAVFRKLREIIPKLIAEQA
jgi:hypothetical protein